jgi:hypothetical protein
VSNTPDLLETTDTGTPDEGRGPGMGRWMKIAFGGLAGAIVVGLVIAIVGALADSEGVSNFFRIVRDFFIILLALQGILICVALIILITQVSALINLLENEIKPLLEEARETISTARGTAEFVSKNVASPIIRTAAALSGARAFVVELLGIRRNLSGRGRR